MKQTDYQQAAALLGIESDSLLDMHYQLCQGLPVDALRTFDNETGLLRAFGALQAGLGIAHDRLTLILQGAEGDRLDTVTSNRLYAMARMAARAATVLGSLQEGVVWMCNAHPLLRHCYPAECCVTDPGLDAALDILNGIEAGTAV